MTEQAVDMEIPTETCTQDIKKSVSLLHRTFRQLRLFRSFRYGRFVSLFFYANATFLIIKMIYDRFLQVVTEHVTIIWPVLF